MTGCTPQHSTKSSTIDQQPMYGGFDRNSVSYLKEADEKLIVDTTNEFGSREKASELFVKQGIRFYAANNLSFAMKRFNQAWLLSPSNPDSFWGFAIVYHDKGQNCESMKMFKEALRLGLSKPVSLADAGRVFTLCGVSNKSLDSKERENLFKDSEQLYKKALSSSPNNGYIYGSWATAYYWREDYINSWKMVKKNRSLGGKLGNKFIDLLTRKMPEPQ